MKNLSYLLLLALPLTFSCGSKTEEKSELLTEGATEITPSDDPAAELKYAVCIWDKASVKEEATAKGKWLASMNLGEKATFLDDEKEDEAGKKTYVKVKLLDGKEGWVQKDFIVTKGRPAAILNDVDFYNRPDLMAKSNKQFSKMDVVGVEAIEGDWVKVAGKRKGGTWIDKGYVKKDNLTYDEKDIAVAVFGAKALAVTDRAKRDAEINKIVANKDLEGSVFINDLRSALTPVITETNDAVPATVDSAAVPAQ